MRRYLVISIVGVVVVALGFFVALAVIGIRDSLYAEKTLHAYMLVIDVVNECVRSKEGGWPRSWEELYGVRPSREPAIWMWPDDHEEIERRIAIDFTLSPQQVAQMTPESFPAIRQIGPRYEISGRGWIAELIASCKKQAD